MKYIKLIGLLFGISFFFLVGCIIYQLLRVDTAYIYQKNWNIDIPNPIKEETPINYSGIDSTRLDFIIIMRNKSKN